MLSKLIELIKPTENAKFMRLFKKFYTIDYKFFDFMFDYLIYIKLFDERIKAIKIELTRNNQILLYLSMFLPEQYQHIAKMQSMINNMAIDKAQFILLKEKYWTKKNSQDIISLIVS